MATAKSKKPAAKPVSAKQAKAVADLLKSQKTGANGSGSTNSGPSVPDPSKTNPVTTDDDADDEE